MFSSINDLRIRAATHAADAIDLLIEFATLGEYGLERPDRPAPTLPSAARTAAPCATPGRRRQGRRDQVAAPSPRRDPHRRPSTDRRRGSSRGNAVPRDRQAHALPSVLRAPRIRLEDLAV